MKPRLQDGDVVRFAHEIDNFGRVEVEATFQAPEPWFSGGWFVTRVWVSSLGAPAWLDPLEAYEKFGAGALEDMEDKARRLGEQQAEPDPDKERS